MLFAAVLIYSVLDVIVLGAAARASSTMEVTLRRSLGPSTLRCVLRWIVLSLPTWTVGAACAMWISYVFNSSAAYIVGIWPVVLALIGMLLWQCITVSRREDFPGTPRYIVPLS